MTSRNVFASLIAASLSIIVANQAHAVATQMVHMNLAQCDTLFIPDDVHEIGDISVFPSSERLISGSVSSTSGSACPSTDNPTIPNAVVDIRNESGIAWEEVWYVADPETSISNYDGEANEFPFSPIQEAFRIDSDVNDPGGINHALVFESMMPDGIWEINETWQFILQDYTNLSGLSAGDINSIGVGDNSPNFGILDSSGSIIAVTTIPEPASLALFGIGVAAAGIRRR